MLKRFWDIVTRITPILTIAGFWLAYQRYNGDFAELKKSLDEINMGRTFAVSTPVENSRLKLENGISVTLRGHMLRKLPPGMKAYVTLYHGGSHYISVADLDTSLSNWSLPIYPSGLNGDISVYFCLADQEGQKWISEWRKSQGDHPGSVQKNDLPPSVHKATMLQYTCCE